MEEKLDYKKEYKDIYLPKTKPMIIEIPKMNYVMVDGIGDPNQEDGEYKKAMEILYGLSFTIKMSKMGSKKIDGYFDYVVPPLEGMWWMKGQTGGIDYAHKEKFCWISMIRQPEFVTKEVFEWACSELKKKKPEIDLSKTHFTQLEEGLCVQIMHKGSYDNEPETIEILHQYIKEQNLKNAIGDKNSDGKTRLHHEIYLSDPRKTDPKNLKTVIRIPVKR